MLAKDAAELVEVNWEPLPAVTDLRAAMEDGAPLVHDDFGTNVSSVWDFEARLAGPAQAPIQALLRRPRPGEGQGDRFRRGG